MCVVMVWMGYWLEDGCYACSIQDKFRYIFKATKQHAKNLGTFATIYKAAMFALKRLNGNKEADIHPFIAGLLGGYYVFGENNSINQQVCVDQSCIIIK